MKINGEGTLHILLRDGDHKMAFEFMFILYLTHYMFTVFEKYTKNRIMSKIVKYELKNA